MKLTDDVRDRTGRFLLGAGDELTSKHLRIFRMWGVLEVSITGVEADGDAACLPGDADPRLLEEAEAALLPRFGCVDLEHPVFRELFRLAVMRKVYHDRL